MSLIVKKVDIANTESTSEVLSASKIFGYLPFIIYCPAIVTGTLMRIYVENPDTGEFHALAASNGADDPITISANKPIPLDINVARVLRSKNFKLVTETAQGQLTTFVIEYQKVNF